MIQRVTRYLTQHPKLLLWCLSAITISAILLTLIPADYLSKSRIWSYDKLGHLLLFGSWTFFLGLYSMVRYPGRTNLWKIFSLGIIFGGLIELLQYILPINRHGNLIDFCVDSLGAVGAIVLLKLFVQPDSEQ
ncbi:MAG: VanZ family protein [Balneolaceae bacterium]|nr:VanZ family protein [Balneolaceae bacterium]